ncbi:MAG: biotin synthase BioB [Candidatus Firestonebacteria bacterium]|nr:biotin synthase BioB [Candidatus Firestonebacteria bacterium]
MEKIILDCKSKVMNGEKLTSKDAFILFSLETKKYLLLLMHAANAVRRKYKGDFVDLCSLVNAKSGSCTEDCKFCAQSSHNNAQCTTYPFIGVDAIVKRAREVKKIGAHRFCIVTSGNEVSASEFEQILEAVRIIRNDLKMEMDCSLGYLETERILSLKNAGVTRYNHNIETSPDYFKKICTTHTFEKRLETIKSVTEFGMERCCGGIIGMGETQNDRIELALLLQNMEIECIPINILNPRHGTPLEKTESLPPLEILKIISIFRLLNPKSTIKIAGGREHNLRSLQAMSLLAGGNGFIISGYLTTSGQPIEADFNMLKDLELDF